MEVMENKFVLIEKYLMNDMSVGEIKKFEKQLSEDSDLKKEFLLRKRLNEAISENDVIDLRESLIEITSDKNRNNLFKSINRIRKPLSIAATILILISISLSILLPFKQSPDQLFSSNYNTYPALANIRSLESNQKSDELLFRSFSFYEKHNYKKASESFSKVLIIDSSNVIASFYLALCELENNNLEISEDYLYDLIQRKDHLFWEQAHWYLAMIYLKQEDNDQAKLVFEEIIEEEMVYITKAKRILRKLH
jgi:tetratricopeptide (TPR) repeat protein